MCKSPGLCMSSCVAHCALGGGVFAPTPAVIVVVIYDCILMFAVLTLRERESFGVNTFCWPFKW